ncbi:transglycosylase SLT domain-containing protein [Bacteroides heparinolyticus]|uniref:transglycosylase SLT domain-containing protein n=1 Tax=Prevotella heparinolytica TaxID=28113 RepID=UPI00359FF27E
MVKYLRTVYFFILFMVAGPISASNPELASGNSKGSPVAASNSTTNEVQGTDYTSNFNWEPVINAIIQVESSGDPNAESGNSVGVMQITPILVAECNSILRGRKSKKRYKLSDRFSIQKSKEMFLLIQSKYNPLNNVEKAIRSWNGGMRYSIRQTQRYFEKVMKAMH